MTRAAVALCLVAGLAAFVGHALGRRAPTPRTPASEARLEVLARDLALRPDQIAALGGLFAEQDRDLQVLVDEARDALATPTAARLQRTEDDMLALLDPDQRSRYLALVGATTESRQDH